MCAVTSVWWRSVRTGRFASRVGCRARRRGWSCRPMGPLLTKPGPAWSVSALPRTHGESAARTTAVRGTASAFEAHTTVAANPVPPPLHSETGSRPSALAAESVALRTRPILGSSTEPEEGSCLSCCSIALVGADRRPQCRDSTTVGRRPASVCATPPIHPRSRRSSPSCAPPVTASMAVGCAA